jgi:hypothetical protein
MPLPGSCKICNAGGGAGEAASGGDNNRAGGMAPKESSKERGVALDCRRHLLIIPRFLTPSGERSDDEGK